MTISTMPCNSMRELTIDDSNLTATDIEARKVFGIEDDTTKSSTIPNNSMGEPTINDDNPTVKNGRILDFNEPSHNILSTAGIINTSGNVTTNLEGSSNIKGPISVGGVQTSNNGRLVGYFNSENVFNLSHKVLSEAEIKVLGKGLQFVPTSSKIDEVVLRKYLMNLAVECVISGILERI